MILLLKILCALALGLGSGLVFLAVVKPDLRERPDNQRWWRWMWGKR